MSYVDSSDGMDGDAAGEEPRATGADEVMTPARSAIDAHRSSGLFAIARPTATSTHAGRSGRTLVGRGTGSVRCPVRIAIASSPANGTRPVSISNITAPRL